MQKMEAHRPLGGPPWDAGGWTQEAGRVQARAQLAELRSVGLGSLAPQHCLFLAAEMQLQICLDSLVGIWTTHEDLE